MIRPPDLERAVIDEADAAREDLVALCAALVAAPSVNPDGDTRAVAAVVTQALTERGVESRIECEVPTMPSVVAELDSGLPGPHLVFNMHLDTMPPGDEGAWSVPVWEVTRRSGRLYGLGMGNMKGAVAAAVHAVGALQARRDLWRGRITLTAVSDEVVFGEHGAAFLLRQHPHLLGDALICGEGPGFRRTAVGEKGVLWLALTTVGASGHASSVQPGASASARLASAVSRIDALNGYGGALPDDLSVLRPHGLHDTGLALTANVGTLSAGTFVGQVAVAGRAEIDLRLPPGVGVDDAESLVRQTVSDLPGIEINRIKGWDANWTAPVDPLLRHWATAWQAVNGTDPQWAIRLPASDASRWRRAGVPALCYGPQPSYSAGIDDYAEEDDVVRCAALYVATALRYLDGP